MNASCARPRSRLIADQPDSSRNSFRWYFATSRSKARLSPRCTRSTNCQSTSRSLNRQASSARPRNSHRQTRPAHLVRNPRALVCHLPAGRAAAATPPAAGASARATSNPARRRAARRRLQADEVPAAYRTAVGCSAPSPPALICPSASTASRHAVARRPPTNEKHDGADRGERRAILADDGASSAASPRRRNRQGQPPRAARMRRAAARSGQIDAEGDGFRHA